MDESTRSWIQTQLTRAQEVGAKGIIITESEHFSADTIHRWFPQFFVAWDSKKRIHIRWNEE